MEIDVTTLYDLGIFSTEADKSIAEKLNFTSTTKGREQLYKFLKTTLGSVSDVLETQQTIQQFLAKQEKWPKTISNGTIMVLEKLYQGQIDTIPQKATLADALQYKWLHSHDFKLLSYTAKHFLDFVQGMQQICEDYASNENANLLKTNIALAQTQLQHSSIQFALSKSLNNKLTAAQVLQIAYSMLYSGKNALLNLLQIYAKFDAWNSMAKATQAYKLVFPVFAKVGQPTFNAQGLFHLLLQNPVNYAIDISKQQNFMFLTGANMAGKSTFIKACGAALYLAHVGMAVPAQAMELSFFDGIISNINVQDDITKGESYFYNEVQRIKSTIEKINNGKTWMVLIDELFKGTNVQDAMKCSSSVIEGLLKVKQSLFILSTHLYEIGHDLQKHPNICFNYFETNIQNEQLQFSYQLKNGISNDRLGYLILKREGVVEMLNNLH
jgi:DNA mismatch repair protein MutS